jgi:hypothetical protein
VNNVFRWNRQVLVRVTIAAIAAVASLTPAGDPVRGVRAEDTVNLDVTFSTSDVGTFAVTLLGTGGDEPSFGTVELDADLDEVVSAELTLEYTDTVLERGGGDVFLSIDSFEPVDPVPPFEGSDQVHFQIPNRYLILTDVGMVEPTTTPDACSIPVGAITANESDEGATFDNGVPRIVANVAEGCGVGTASQPIELTLTVPAGVYPTAYSATVTIETTIE